MEKNEIRSKPLELCNTRIMKSNLDTYFYVILARLDMVNDAARVTRRRLKFKGLSLPTKCRKNEGLSKTWVLTRKQFEVFRQNKIHF